jgi:hypothetical protein
MRSRVVTALGYGAVVAWNLPPSIVVDHVVWNAGVVPKGHSLTHAFAFRNRGYSVLVVEETRSSCSCATSRLPSREIAPGETGNLIVTFSSGALDEGAVSRNVVVSTNDPRQPLVRLQIEATIEAEFKLSSEVAALAPGQVSTEILISPRTDRRLSCADVRPVSGAVRARLDSSSGENRVCRIMIQRLSNAIPPMTKLMDRVVVLTDSPLTPELTIPVFATTSRSSLGIRPGAVVNPNR